MLTFYNYLNNYSEVITTIMIMIFTSEIVAVVPTYTYMTLLGDYQLNERKIFQWNGDFLAEH